MFGSLHTRSHFSFLDGGSSPEVLAESAQACGHTALAITDLHGVYAAVRHQRACRRLGLKGLIGIDCGLLLGDTTSRVDLTILARNADGYRAICRLSTWLHEHHELSNEQLAPGGSFDDLVADRCIIIVHTLSAQAEDVEEVLRMLGVRTDLCVYAGISHDGRPWAVRRMRAMVERARRMGLRIVLAQDVRYAGRDAYAVHDLMICIREGITIHQPHPLRPVHDRNCLRSEQDLRSIVPFPEAFDAVDEIIRLCDFDLLPEHITPPGARVPDGRTSDDVLRQMSHDAFDQRYARASATTQQRARELLEHELQVIAELHLSDFFLVVHEVTEHARSRGIRCSGRGSAANSVVAYVLGITGVCPVEHHLLFERFLHRGRKGTPDIDVDFDSERRGEVIAWMEERFGLEQTAMTATIITYRLRMAIRDAAKALGWPKETVRALSKAVPGYTNNDVEIYRTELAAVVGEVPMLDILLKSVQLLIDHPRHLGQHSGGMVLSSKPLEMLTPVQRSANGVAVVQFDKDDVEALGLVKFDVLGLRMLACISECCELVARHTGSMPEIDDLPLDDAKTFETIRSGRTLGIFQIESQGQIHLLAKHQPERFSDLVTEVALFRPGPLQGGMVHPYIARRRGKEPVTFPHPDLEPILADTLGIVLFQEQVLEIAHRFAGMTLEEADDFRSLVSKNRDRHLMASMRERFVQGACRRGVSRECAEHVYEIVSHFVGYGFCRSHAAAFAKIVYQSAWLKTHHTAAYMAAFMQHRPGMYNLMTLEEESRRWGVQILPCHIMHSGMRYDLEVDQHGRMAIRKPLTAMRSVSEDIARQIIWERSRAPFTSVEDVVMHLPEVPRDTLEVIAMAGAMHNLEPDARRAAWIVGVVRQRQSKAADEPLFSVPMVSDQDVPMLPELRAQERLAYDYIMQGAARVHPMTLYRRSMMSMEIRPIETLRRLSPDAKLTVTTAGIVILRQAPPTANGMLFVTLEDESGFLQCVVPPQVRERFRQELRSSALVLRGTLHGIGSWRSIMVSDVHVLTKVIGGYHGHLSYAGGRDTLEVGQVHTFA
ncbi:MAG: DNA polymerase III subunit alpha [Candidatus Kapaibacterium sp.]